MPSMQCNGEGIFLPLSHIISILCLGTHHSNNSSRQSTTSIFAGCSWAQDSSERDFTLGLPSSSKFEEWNGIWFDLNIIERVQEKSKIILFSQKNPSQKLEEFFRSSSSEDKNRREKKNLHFTTALTKSVKMQTIGYWQHENDAVKFQQQRKQPSITSPIYELPE